MADASDDVEGPVGSSGAVATRADSPRPATRLRVGLLVDSTVQPRWRRQVVAEVASLADCELVLIVHARPGPDPASSGRAGLLYRLYERIDRSLFRRGPDALDEVDVADLIGDRASVEVALHAGDESFGEADLDRIRRFALDVVVCLGPEPRGARVPRLARHGAWAYRFEDPRGVRDVLRCRPSTVVSLDVLSTDKGGAGRSILRATLKTHRLSTRRHGDQLGRVSSSLG